MKILYLVLLLPSLVSFFVVEVARIYTKFLTPKGPLNPIWVLEVLVTLDEVSIFTLSFSNFW